MIGLPEITRLGLEPRMREPKSLVLPITPPGRSVQNQKTPLPTTDHRPIKRTSVHRYSSLPHFASSTDLPTTLYLEGQTFKLDSKVHRNQTDEVRHNQRH